MIRMLLTPDKTYNNLFDAHPPFQIDGNFGAVSGINEMLMQSHNGKIQLLPALPSNWEDGHIVGLRARGGFVLDSMAWNGRSLEFVSFTSQCGGTLNLIYKGNSVSVETKAGEVYQFDANMKLTNKPFDPIVIPARIEAEEYTSMSGVQIEPDVNGIPNLGWINDGDWSKYLIDAPVADKYIIRANVASEAEEPSQISVLDSAGALLGTLTVDPEKTDGWNDWYEAESSVTLPRGVQELTLRYSGESAFLMNIDWFELEPMDNNSVADIQSAASEIKLLSIVDGRVDLLITPQTDDTYTVYLYGVDGKTLSTFSGKGMKHLRFGDYSPLPTGIYNIVVEKDKDQQQLKILVKD